MSNDGKSCRPLRTEWVPAAYRDDKGRDELVKPIERSVVEGFEKKVLKKGLIKKLR